MCGIVGFINKERDEHCLREMAASIEKRGPDDSGFYFDQHIALAQNRLAVLDLSAKGHQPYIFNDWVLVFNGEIYNYKEIRNDLRKYEYNFESDTDTEVLIKAFDKWGIGCIQQFRGMFAFGIYNKKDNKLWLCRDRAGVKPLYYSTHADTLAFASELTAFRHYMPVSERNELDVSGLSEFLTFGYISGDLSILAGVKKLLPGHYLLYHNGCTQISNYWRPSFSENTSWLSRTDDDIADELESIITESFRYRMVADVPIGIFLSSGIDSSLVASVLSRSDPGINTFTIGFQEKNYDESQNAQKIATYLNTNHTTTILTSDQANIIASKFYEIYDEPFADSSGIAATYVSQIARGKGMKVVLSADGGDELFGGYTRYTEFITRWSQINRLGKPGRIMGAGIFEMMNLFRNDANRVERFIDILKSKDFIDFYQHIIRTSSVGEIKALFPQYLSPTSEGYYEESSLYNTMMRWDFNKYLPGDNLTKMDRATMFNSIEGREPFLDHNIIEFAAQLPLKFKIRNGEKKYILKKLLSRYLPDELFRLPKKGFSIPLASWIEEAYKLDIKSMYEKGLFTNPYLNETAVTNMIHAFMNKKSYNAPLLWYVYIFQKWYNNWQKY